MMESYTEFLNRINSFETKDFYLGEGSFNVSNSVLLKVDENNSFKSYYGDTIVFDLDQDTKNYLNNCVGLLYENAKECFSERLNSNSFHLTLHDLSNSTCLTDRSNEMICNEHKIIDLKKEIKFDTIKMKSKCILNMVNTSLAMCFYPECEEEYDKIMALYSLFDDVRELNYPFTPHITLAYYNYYGFSENAKRKLENVVLELNSSDIIIELSCSNLWYQRFTSMNDYISQICLGRNEG